MICYFQKLWLSPGVGVWTPTLFYYFEDYHYHPENQSMGFCTDKNHTNESITKLLPISLDDSDYDVVCGYDEDCP